MKIKTVLLFFMMIAIVCFTAIFIYARETGDLKSNKVNAPLGSPAFTRVNINNLSMWIGDNLISAQDPRTSASGLEFPRAISNTLATIFIDGLVWGGQVDDGQSPALRIGGLQYNVGTVAGAVISPGVVESSDAPDVRIYRIRKDYATADLTLDAAELSLSVDQVRQQYALDWAEWPYQKGAPFTGIDNELDGGYLGPDGETVLGQGNGVLDRGEDANSNGILDPGEDTNGNGKLDGEVPGIAGADQVVWTVANDEPTGVAAFFSGSPAIGFEVQLTLWGYNRTDALGNMIFKQYKLIYKGTGTTPPSAAVDPMYISQWSDPDLGTYSDDFVGVDSTLSLFYVYNSSSVDGTYAGFGFPPPATGYDFFQGPVVAGTAEDVAIVNLQRRSGFRNLPLTSFAYFASGTSISDPGPLGQYETTQEWWNLMRGFLPQSDFNNPEPYTLNDGVTPTKYPLAGDPVAGTGDLDGVIISPGDRRMLGVTGPFRMAVGDTQEVVIATIAALGSDRLSSVAVLKFFDRTAQATYDNLFKVVPPPSPPDTRTTGLNGKILLNWGFNPTAIAATEGQVAGSFAFEGYNVYQLKSNSPDLGPGNAIKLATFDKVDEITTVLSEVFDQTSGVIVDIPVQVGTNSGIKRTFTVTQDAFRSRPLSNDQNYYFAVTAYNASQDPELTTRALESSPIVITARPKNPPPGERLTAVAGDTIAVTHEGGSDGSVTPIIVDPTSLTGDEYEVTFHVTEDGETLWDLANLTTGETLLADQTNQSGNSDYFIIDGVQTIVAGPPPGVKQGDPPGPGAGWDIPSGTRRFTFAGADFGDPLTAFHGALGWGSPARVFGVIPAATPSPIPAVDLKPVVLILASVTTDGTFDTNDENVSYGYRYLRGATLAPAQPEFAPYILNPSGGYAFQQFSKNVPLAAYDMSNPDSPRRLVVGFLENNAENGLVNGEYFPGDYQVYDNVAGSGPREWLFIYDQDYSETEDPSLAVDILSNDLPVMYWATWNRRGDVPFSPGGTGEDQFAIFPNIPNSEADVFTYETSAPTFSQALEKTDALAQVGVFPNPYLAVNRLETSRTNRFVRFNHLPANTTVRIFNLAGTLVRTLNPEEQVDQYMDWDLQNQNQLPVASGIYIAHVEMPGVGSKDLKLVVVQEQQFLKTY